ncbi:hypothetical protein JOF29_003296 [Kribbella aluminosa]|uniref:Uncharacterized protein n=1 Tax=Kribbella aluminosa TaxID=416017 RepID=A0ABS4UKN2_9ACTN|nr:hypothetical protein [Kribbella aluminosa]
MSRAGDHVAWAVASGDWDAIAGRFALGATVRFVGVAVGPFEGRTVIAAAGRVNAPDESV